MRIQLIRKCVAMAAIGLSLASVNVSADCTDGAGLGTEALKQFNVNIGNSENAPLVKAYQGGQCTITQGVHGGGKPCPNGSNIKSHITVKILPGGPTCHVFDVQRNGGNCTTCE